MKKNFKPDSYNSVSPYFTVDDAEAFIDFLVKVFGAELLRRYDRPDGKIMHAEMRIDDSVIMLANSTDQWPPATVIIHVYLPNVDEVYDRALMHGCTVVQPPKQQEGDPDRRGTFKDFAGNMWSVSTQI